MAGWVVFPWAARRFLTDSLVAFRRQRLPAFAKLRALLMRHLDSALNYCHEKVPFVRVEPMNGNIRAMLRWVAATAVIGTRSSKFRRPQPPAASVRPRDYRARCRFRRGASTVSDLPLREHFLGERAEACITCLVTSLNAQSCTHAVNQLACKSIEVG